MYSLEQIKSEQFLIDHGWVSMKVNNSIVFLCPVEEWKNGRMYRQVHY